MTCRDRRDKTPFGCFVSIDVRFDDMPPLFMHIIERAILYQASSCLIFAIRLHFKCIPTRLLIHQTQLPQIVQPHLLAPKEAGQISRDIPSTTYNLSISRTPKLGLSTGLTILLSLFSRRPKDTIIQTVLYTYISQRPNATANPLRQPQPQLIGPRRQTNDIAHLYLEFSTSPLAPFPISRFLLIHLYTACLHDK